MGSNFILKDFRNSCNFLNSNYWFCFVLEIACFFLLLTLFLLEIYRFLIREFSRIENTEKKNSKNFELTRLSEFKEFIQLNDISMKQFFHLQLLFLFKIHCFLITTTNSREFHRIENTGNKNFLNFELIRYSELKELIQRYLNETILSSSTFIFIINSSLPNYNKPTYANSESKLQSLRIPKISN